VEHQKQKKTGVSAIAGTGSSGAPNHIREDFVFSNGWKLEAGMLLINGMAEREHPCRDSMDPLIVLYP
jgi:hypothetical protein